MDRLKAKVVQIKVMETIKDLLAENGVFVKKVKVSYGLNECKISVECIEGKNSQDAERKEFANWCAYYKLRPEDYGQEFTVAGKRYKLVGFNPRRPKYCFVAVNMFTGERVMWTADIMKLKDFKDIYERDIKKAV